MKGKVLISFAVIYLVWGSTFTAIKLGLESFPPITLAACRFLISGLIFLFLSRLKDIRSMSRSEIKNEMIVGVLLNIGNAGVCWSEQYLSSGIAALIVGALPVIFILFNWISFEKKVPHYSVFFAVVLGILGISLISSDDSSSADWKVVLVLILANVAWVAGSLKFRMSKSGLSYYPRAAVQLLTGSLSLFIFSTLFGEKVIVSSITLPGVFSVLYLAVAGTVIAYSAYSFLLKNIKTELVSTYALINPLVALILGILFLGEPFTATISLSAALIILSVVLTIYGDRLFGSFQRKQHPDETSEVSIKECG